MATTGFYIFNIFDWCVTFSLMYTFLLSYLQNPKFLSSNSCILLVKPASVAPAWIPIFLISRSPSIGVYFIDYISTFGSWMVLSISFHCLCFSKIKGFTYVLFMNFYHNHKDYYKVLFLLLCCDEILKAWCCRAPGLVVT